MNLKPCPFCGSTELQLCRTNEHACWVRCDDCGADAPSTEKREDAIDIWNTRPDVDRPAMFVIDDELDLQFPTSESEPA